MVVFIVFIVFIYGHIVQQLTHIYWPTSGFRFNFYYWQMVSLSLYIWSTYILPILHVQGFATWCSQFLYIPLFNYRLCLLQLGIDKRLAAYLLCLSRSLDAMFTMFPMYSTFSPISNPSLYHTPHLLIIFATK